MRTTKTTTLLIVSVREETELTPIAAIDATGEVIRARPIRSIRTTDSSAEFAKKLDALGSWLARVAS